MAGSIKSGLVGSLLSAVIWMMIATAVGFGKMPVILGGFCCLIGTFLISAAIARTIGRSRQAST